MGQNGYERLRLVTPVLVTVCIFLLGVLMTTVNKIDNKLFTHLTNEELHIPRGNLVMRNEWILKNELIETRVKSFNSGILKVEENIKGYLYNMKYSIKEDVIKELNAKN